MSDNKIVVLPPQDPQGEGKFDAAAFNAEIGRIALVSKSWLHGLVEARRIARQYLPTLNASDQQTVIDADRTAMRVINDSINMMLDSKPICGTQSKTPPAGGDTEPDGSSPTSVGSTD